MNVRPGANPSSKQVKWGLDLKEEEYAQRFVLALKELSANLKKKIDAETALRDLPAAPAPPDQPTRKERGKRRARK